MPPIPRGAPPSAAAFAALTAELPNVGPAARGVPAEQMFMAAMRTLAWVSNLLGTAHGVEGQLLEYQLSTVFTSMGRRGLAERLTTEFGPLPTWTVLSSVGADPASASPAVLAAITTSHHGKRPRKQRGKSHLRARRHPSITSSDSDDSSSDSDSTYSRRRRR